MHRLLVFALLVAVSYGLTPVLFGQVKSAETLFPLTTPTTTPSPTSGSTDHDSSQHDGTTRDTLPFDTINDDLDVPDFLK